MGRKVYRGQGREGKGVGKRGGDGKFRGQPPPLPTPNVFFLEQRLQTW